MNRPWHDFKLSWWAPIYRHRGVVIDPHLVCDRPESCFYSNSKGDGLGVGVTDGLEWLWEKSSHAAAGGTGPDRTGKGSDEQVTSLTRLTRHDGTTGSGSAVPASFI